jgi:RNA polymerase sigma-70 factor (ECF subfamily)
LDEVAKEPRLATYQPFWAARAELLGRAGHAFAAREAFDRAIGLETDAAIRQFLERRCRELAERGGLAR